MDGENTGKPYFSMDDLGVPLFSETSIWVFPQMVVPPKHPKMIIFSRKTHGFWGNPPFSETSIC